MSIPQLAGRFTLPRNEILRLGQTLPAAPRIMSELGDILKDIDTDISDIARILRTDPALMTRVIRMSNTIMFGGSAEITDIEHALARVGFSNVLGLVGAAGITQLTPKPLRIYGLDIDTFQRCSLCHALAAENLARAVGEDTHSAYIAALLRGIGMVVLDRAAGDLDEPPEPIALSQNPCYSDFEHRLFGLTSVDVTRILMDEWNFPEVIVKAIDLHHLTAPDALNDRLACVVNVAGEMAAASGYGFPGDERHWTTAPGKYDVLGLSLEYWTELSQQASERFFGACESLKAS